MDVWARKRYLQGIRYFAGKKVTFQLYENTRLDVVVETFDSHTRQVIVKDLTTPLGTYPCAILRCSDVITCFTV
ncbi:hypothetical protein Gasu2_59050 [Galdieria sulphuraria]|uniref:Uncharacterized protein n=1 Tax=Galdieria sulphuraria TaxID=130081 RepID=M2XDE7_GALSU|nr:uncharacterized protein Gasu_44940 [Galdieria sulphuraria]EME27992.1 hypothetical protein Gasu_44940 [Galdieria sulphuraria]GJD11779.1 hypothetical protein Gasu2_59050 [Galdieria sulphuraria]|eukprot:XP_005704512.1 hypothetical protein Gasu_44940 [Galdieria sulphuraria]